MELFFAVTENGTLYAMNVDEASGRMVLERGNPAHGYKAPIDGIWCQDMLDTFRSMWTLSTEVCHSANPYRTSAVYID
jgi:hypothetical protein